ncbi:MAG: DUF370 domain-containing protein [Clostridiales bacterium]|nr:DUF370 domain-containing protein [Clostridiales bacterium]
MKLLNIGFGNFVNADKILAVLSPESSPVKRLIKEGKEGGKVIDATQGRQTKSVIVTNADKLFLAYLTPEQIEERISGLPAEGNL